MEDTDENHSDLSLLSRLLGVGYAGVGVRSAGVGNEVRWGGRISHFIFNVSVPSSVKLDSIYLNMPC